jgi:tetratricopeptide (TPR) repeat protein
VPDADALGHELRVTSAEGEVDGSSLGVAFAAATLSRWAGVAPAAEVAATAAVDGYGKLLQVKGLVPKLEALSARYPAVRRVVVATEQDPPEPALAGVTLVRCGTLDEALTELGLDLDAVESAPLPTADAEGRIARLKSLHVADYAADGWRERAMGARILAAHPKLDRSDAAVARAFAALFHLHAGDTTEAITLACSIDDEVVEDLPGASQAWVWIVKSTSAIDAGQYAEALAKGERAVAVARTLGRAERREVLGRAVGTLGRARMHAGDDAGAVEPLRESAEHHAAHLPREASRSWNTLALALRRAGRHEEALAVLNTSQRAMDAHADEPESATSQLYLEYERGRVLFELGRDEQALASFERVLHRQSSPYDYPRVGCLRYLATLAARRSDPRAREWLGEALRVARSAQGPVARVAATAAMALFAEASPPLTELSTDAEGLWGRLFDGSLSQPAVEHAVHTIVY